jgi:hypothetical protein
MDQQIKEWDGRLESTQKQKDKYRHKWTKENTKKNEQKSKTTKQLKENKNTKGCKCWTTRANYISRSCTIISSKECKNANKATNKDTFWGLDVLKFKMVIYPLGIGIFLSKSYKHKNNDNNNNNL